ncbi:MULTISPECIES: hypothetical protein [Rhizobium]|uniref:hypothetical protein n=1 Tax=Rhizobium TaxID=379 RepID=UPI00195B2869|nr:MULTISPECIES: hypothetical protein [Rhizobium]MBM7050352.1 hypothetical protein [Rhizobium lusitanum]
MKKQSQSPPFLPEEIAQMSAECLCGERIFPALFDRHEEPFEPIVPYGQDGSKGAWVQQATEVNCQCGRSVQFPLNPVTPAGSVEFFGDEADRELGNYFFQGYSLVGGTSGQIVDLAKGLAEVKANWVSGVKPESWTIHTKDLIDGRQRRQHPIYKQISEDRVFPFLQACANVLRDHDEFAWNHYVFSICKHSSDKRERQRELKAVKIANHQALLSMAIYRATAQGLRPRFNFEAIREIKAFPHIEGWSQDSYLGSRHYLAHALLSHGTFVPAPIFVNPRSHPCLELADIHAFFAARTVFKRFRGSVPEIGLPQFGRFVYHALVSPDRAIRAGDDDIDSSLIPTE